MSTFSKAVYFGSILLQVIFGISKVTGNLLTDTWVWGAYVSPFTWMMVYGLITLIYIVAYISYVQGNPSISDKTLWSLFILTLGPLAQMVYWWRWIRTA
jgi:hypothetical protein